MAKTAKEILKDLDQLLKSNQSVKFTEVLASTLQEDPQLLDINAPIGKRQHTLLYRAAYLGDLDCVEQLFAAPPLFSYSQSLQSLPQTIKNPLVIKGIREAK